MLVSDITEPLSASKMSLFAGGKILFGISIPVLDIRKQVYRNNKYVLAIGDPLTGEQIFV